MASSKQKKKARKQRWNDCNVVHQLPEAKRLWHFSVTEKQVVQKSKLDHTLESPLPQKQVEQTWRQFLQKRLNIAWLPAEHVFLRVVHLPMGEDIDETRQMLEFQLEKLSPVPVAQIVWCFEPLPCPDPTQQTVLLVLAERTCIEDLLGELEGAGYQTDRIEFPRIHGLTSQSTESDCVRIELKERADDSLDCLISWHLNGWIQHVGIANFPASEQGAKLLIDHLNNTAWTGELDGWMGEVPSVELVGEDCLPDGWITALEKWTHEDVIVDPALEEEALAHTSAERASRSLSNANLMPEEIRGRYRQQYIDGLWMSSLGGIALVYIFAVLIYFVALEWRRGENIDMQTAMRSKANAYTNTMQLQAKVQILQEQVDLKYSALDCLKTTAELLPDGMSLLSFNFRQGKMVTLRGNVPDDQTHKVTDYHGSLIAAKIGDNPLFSNVSDPSISTSSGRRTRGGSQTSTWSFNCELRRSGFE